MYAPATKPEKYKNHETPHRHTVCIIYRTLPMIKTRYVVTAWATMGIMLVYMMRVNLSVAIGPMATQFGWSNSTRGFVLAAFFIGYVIGQVPGGYIAGRYGAKHVFGVGVLATALLTMLIPVTACGGSWTCPVKHDVNGTALVTPASTVSIEVLRVFMGLFESVTYPALMALLSRWAPPSERSFMVAICFSGAQLGTAVAFPLAAYISTAAPTNGFWSGWPGVFYIFGAIGCIWFVGWCFYVYSSPETHPRISTGEKIYITSRLPRSVSVSGRNGTENHKGAGDNGGVPLFQFMKNVFTNLPALAIFVTHFTNNWSLYLMITWMPNYMEKMLDFNLRSSGLCFVPYLAMGFLSIWTGMFADALIMKWKWSRRNVRIAMQLSGNLVPAAAFIWLGFVNSKWLAFGIMVVAVSSSAMSYSGYSPNVLEICPKHAGVFYGVSNTIATIPGIVAPALAGAMVSSPPKQSEWQSVFAIAAGLYIAGDIFYVCFASSEPQECLGGGKDADGAGIQYKALEDAPDDVA